MLVYCTTPARHIHMALSVEKRSGEFEETGAQFSRNVYMPRQCKVILSHARHNAFGRCAKNIGKHQLAWNEIKGRRINTRRGESEYSWASR